MENGKMITLESLLRHYKLDLAFIRSLEEYGLVKITEVEHEACVEEQCLGDLEMMIRLHYDLEINMAGIDVIYNLLHKMNEMQAEVNRLRNRMGDL